MEEQSRSPVAGRRVVAIGGGHGLARTLEALLLLDVDPTAVVTVADDGGSSGRLRREQGVIALGDIRMALETLAGDGAWSEMLGHRFAAGYLQGHALGNLILLAMIEQAEGDVVAALDRALTVLGARGRVLPCTTDRVSLSAEVDGVRVDGQVAVATTAGRRRTVWLEPADPMACVEAVDAIAAADVIVMGPGSLYTSIIPNLLVPGITAAVAASDVPIVYVANLTWQPGETAGMDLRDHVLALAACLPPSRRLRVLLHDGPRAEGSGDPLGTDLADVPLESVTQADLAQRRADGVPVAAHDAKRLALALQSLLG